MNQLLEPSLVLSIAFCASLGWFLGGVAAGLIKFIITLIFTFIAAYSSGQGEK